MYKIGKSTIFLGFVVSSLSFGMEIIRVKTLVDNGVTPIEAWKVKKSCVLGLLQAHQKKTTKKTKYIIIPEARQAIHTITKTDVGIFSKFLDCHESEQKDYFDAVSIKKKYRLIFAMGILGATAQSAQLLDYYFPADIVRLIVPEMIKGELESHIIKKAIKNNDGCEPTKINFGLYASINSQLSSFCKATCYSNAINLLKTTAYCGDDQKLVICMGNCIVVWDQQLYKSYNWLKKISIKDKDCVINNIVVYGKTGKIVVGATNGKLYMIDISLGKEIALLEGHKKSPINGMSRNDEHGIIVSSTIGIADNLIVWDGENGDCLLHLVGHAGITRAKISIDGKYIISKSPLEVCRWELYPDSVRNMINGMKTRLTCMQAQSLYSLCQAIKNKTIVSERKKNELYNFLQTSCVDIQIKEFLENYLI